MIRLLYGQDFQRITFYYGQVWKDIYTIKHNKYNSRGKIIFLKQNIPIITFLLFVWHSFLFKSMHAKWFRTFFGYMNTLYYLHHLHQVVVTHILYQRNGKKGSTWERHAYPEA